MKLQDFISKTLAAIAGGIGENATGPIRFEITLRGELDEVVVFDGASKEQNVSAAPRITFEVVWPG